VAKENFYFRVLKIVYDDYVDAYRMAEVMFWYAKFDLYDMCVTYAK
jgi:hypothetical protein